MVRQRSSHRSYTHFVHLSKFTLSMMIIFVLVFMVAAPIVSGRNDGIRLVHEAAHSQSDAPPVMRKPNFRGVDQDGQPYRVTADTATQAAEHTIVLEAVIADIQTNDDVWLVLTSHRGVMHAQEKMLQLQGDVQIYHDKGYELYTPKMQVDLNEMQIFGDAQVRMHSEFGHIRANSFAVLDKGDRMVFNENVYVELRP